MELKKELLEFLEANNLFGLEDRENAEGVVDSYLKVYKKQLTLTDVVHTLKDCLIAQKPVEYKNKKHYLTTLEIMDSGEEICELMNTDTYEVISNVNGEEVKIF